MTRHINVETEPTEVNRTTKQKRRTPRRRHKHNITQNREPPQGIIISFFNLPLTACGRRANPPPPLSADKFRYRQL
ncbi:hypothetical protein SLA2020_187220 [Shorea laevis]